MSAASDVLKEEAKNVLQHLLKIPDHTDSRNNDIDVFVEKILLCAIIEALDLIKQQKKNDTVITSFTPNSKKKSSMFD